MFGKRRTIISLYILGFLFLSNIIAWISVYDFTDYLEIVYFNVGQGDSIFIKTPQGHQILIDGGPNEDVLEKLGQEMPFYDKSIDLVISTHPETDHYYGLFEVLKRYSVENILWTGVVKNTAEWQEWKQLIEAEGIVRIAQAGQRIILQDNPLIYIEILHPFENMEGQEVEGANESSIVAYLHYNNISFLFAGDISSKTEKQLEDIQTDVLKVAHHGSKYSSSNEFIEKTNPKLAIIQVGKNSYGHPSPEVLARFEESGIQVLRTDLNNDIKIISNGNDFNISKYEKY